MSCTITREHPSGPRIPCPNADCPGTFAAPEARHRYGDPPARHAAQCDGPGKHIVERVADGPWRPAA